MRAPEVLDNAVWHALRGPQSRFALGSARARRFDPEVVPFAALPDAEMADDWEALRHLVGAGGTAVLFRARIEPPAGWKPLMRLACRQMLLDGPPLAPAARPAAHGAPSLEPLAAADAAAMLDLAGRTRPGPFERRTHELGRYLGVREGGRLVAMAGERLRVPGATEISAVCTDPEARGRGLAAALVGELATSIRARGETPFLHVLTDNTPAIRVYEALGFTTRATGDVVALRVPRAEPEPRAPGRDDAR
jgi:GNAT superfamily N-acetyltransferase